MAAVHRATRDDHGDILAMDRECFPYDWPYPLEETEWWVAVDGRTPVAYAGATPWADGELFLSRAGVLPSHRGQGLQRRLVRARVAWARRAGFDCVYTYTLAHNAASSNNLIACGFRVWSPPRSFGGPGAIHWLLNLVR